MGKWVVRVGRDLQERGWGASGRVGAVADVGPAAAAQERRQTWMITVMVWDVVDTIVFCCWRFRYGSEVFCACLYLRLWVCGTCGHAELVLKISGRVALCSFIRGLIVR